MSEREVKPLMAFVFSLLWPGSRLPLTCTTMVTMSQSGVGTALQCSDSTVNPASLDGVDQNSREKKAQYSLFFLKRKSAQSKNQVIC